jgi:hypothetical protein
MKNLLYSPAHKCLQQKKGNKQIPTCSVSHKPKVGAGRESGQPISSEEGGSGKAILPGSLPGLLHEKATAAPLRAALYRLMGG